MQVELEVLHELLPRHRHRLAEHVLEVVRSARRLLEELFPVLGPLVLQVALVEAPERLLGQCEAAHAVEHLHTQVRDVAERLHVKGVEVGDRRARARRHVAKNAAHEAQRGRLVLEHLKHLHDVLGRVGRREVLRAALP